MANTIRTLVVGNGGRESSLAWRLAEESRVHAVMGHVNATIAGWCRRTNGDYLVGDFLNPALVAAFAKEKAIDLAVVANDSAQAAGVVDALLAAGIPTFGATQRAAEIEWNKVFARNLLQEHLPELNPRHWIVRTSHEVEQLFKDLERQQIPVVIKPRGLTGGKGVKVMGEHLPTYAEAAEYSNEFLTEGIGGGGGVYIEERLEGVEFIV